MSSISQTWLLWGLLSAVLGALTGACEIVARYRDEPIQAIHNRYGYFYITVNAVLAAFGYAFLIHYPKQIFPPLQDDYVMTALVAGFGSMVVLRSKFFVIKGEDGNDYSIGPGIAMETILRMLDRKIDRLRATERQKIVFEIMVNIHDFDGAAKYLEAALVSFQNLSQQEKTVIADLIKQYRDEKDWPNRLRVWAIGYAFLTVLGEKNFRQVVGEMELYLENLKKEIQPKIQDMASTEEKPPRLIKVLD